MTTTIPDLEIIAKTKPEYAQILTPEALRFVATLNSKFNQTRLELLARRQERQLEINAGKLPTFPEETRAIRGGDWKVAECPKDLLDRRVEITGPVERKMMINALNSGARVFMADIEDSLSPSWANVVEGQICLYEAVRRTLTFTSPEGKAYKLNDEIAVLLVRPRGWHLNEDHVLMEGKPVSASLFDFGLYFFHNAKELIARGTGPYFYLPKMESYLEARLWNDVFTYAEESLGVPHGTIRATALLETILAAFEMEEILYELRDHASGLNAGRWDYIFSAIKKFGSLPGYVLPERQMVTMNVPFMRAYCDLLVNTCHRRGAHAMGGMAAFIPSRRDAEINKVAMAKVTEDKERETKQGFDGTWVAHPDLVPLAKQVFDAHLGTRANQKDNLRSDVNVQPSQLIDFTVDGAKISEAGFRNNINVALQYIESWLRGVGAAAIHNLMEDAATAEISRAQLWQWIKNGEKLDDGRLITKELYSAVAAEELAKLTAENPGRYKEAAQILDDLVVNDRFVEFLTIPAYEYIKEKS
ncbi:MAG: malate synthase A [Cyanobacteria bacterium SZAS LIN-2]|nr:malate synthase A [Cyanobacteria bacterium SZAS LIN-3]MBS1995290.1 malate synthase A [Cyanobacteria bacterium SZAS LIN-2]